MLRLLPHAQQQRAPGVRAEAVLLLGKERYYGAGVVSPSLQDVILLLDALTAEGSLVLTRR